MESEKSHSSFIKYEYFQTSDINWYYKLSDWKNVQSFGLVRKSITKKVLVKNDELNTLNRMVSAYLDIAELNALDRHPMTKQITLAFRLYI